MYLENGLSIETEPGCLYLGWISRTCRLCRFVLGVLSNRNLLPRYSPFRGRPDCTDQNKIIIIIINRRIHWFMMDGSPSHPPGWGHWHLRRSQYFIMGTMYEECDWLRPFPPARSHPQTVGLNSVECVRRFPALFCKSSWSGVKIHVGTRAPSGPWPSM